MMSLDAIQGLAQEAAEQSAKRNAQPFVVEAEDKAKWLDQVEHGVTPRLPFPFLGDFTPKGWKQDGEDTFVDSSGFGSESEPAQTVKAFVEALEVGKAYAISQSGQFQVYVRKFKKGRGRPHKAAVAAPEAAPETEVQPEAVAEA